MYLYLRIYKNNLHTQRLHLNYDIYGNVMYDITHLNIIRFTQFEQKILHITNETIVKLTNLTKTLTHLDRYKLMIYLTATNYNTFAIRKVF